MSTYQQITSIKNEYVVQARELNTATGRRKQRKCLLEGEEIIGWASAAGLVIERVFADVRIQDHPLLLKLAEQKIAVFAASEGILKKISDTSYLIPLIGVAQLPERTGTERGDMALVLDDVRDHGNIGTVVRTARAFGIRDLFSTQPDLDLYYKKTIEASRGTVFDVRLECFASGEDALDDIKRRGYQVVATSPHASTLQSLAQFQPKPVALVVGNETNGVSDVVLQQANLVVQIPMSGQVESLNVGVAAGISIYELRLKLVLQMLKQYIQRTLGRDVNVTSKLIQLALDKRLRPVTPFNSSQVILLMVMKCDGTMTLEQIGRDTATFGEELDALLQPLLQSGYVERCDQDAMRLTGVGDQLLTQLWGVVESAEDQVVEGFSDSERKQLADFLRRIQANCSRIVEA